MRMIHRNGRTLCVERDIPLTQEQFERGAPLNKRHTLRFLDALEGDKASAADVARAAAALACFWPKDIATYLLPETAARFEALESVIGPFKREGWG